MEANHQAYADDAPTRDLRMVRSTPAQPYPAPRAHWEAVVPTPLAHKFRAGPGARGRTIILNLNYTQCRTSTLYTMTWDVNIAAVGVLAPGSRIRALNISLGRAAANNATQCIAFDGIQIKDSHYADGSYAPLQIALNGIQTRDLSGSANRPMEIANLNCLVSNTIVARVTNDSNGSLPDIRAPAQGGTAAFQAVFAIEEPDIE